MTMLSLVCNAQKIPVKCFETEFDFGVKEK